MKKESLADIINVSINETLSRTVLTGGSTLIAIAALYGLTMKSGGGIAEFSFPLFVGIIIGTYSSIWVAAALLYWFYKGERPQTSR
jgi:preprotein translocase subunit SecF